MRNKCKQEIDIQYKRILQGLDLDLSMYKNK